MISQNIDSELSEDLEKYVKKGVTNVLEMKRLLGICVTEHFANRNLPSLHNKRFFPRNKTIRSHIAKSRKKLR